MPADPRPTDLTLDSVVLFVSDLAASRWFYEHTLGLRPVAAHARSAAFSLGPVQLRLLPAAEHGVSLQEGHDRSVDITVMVDDLDRCRDLLVARGVRFSRTLEYIIGKTTDFYDLDGHWFSLYQPSEAAMGWPSGPKLAALASGLPIRYPGRVLPAGANPGEALADAFLAYAFLFFSDPDVATAFYDGVLGLEAIEGGPCRRVPTDVESGVVKYDVGSTMLTTHHVASDDKRFRVSTTGTSGIALSFGVANLTKTVDSLSGRGVAFSDWPSRGALGRVAQFADPAGHILLLQEAATDAGRRVQAGASAASSVAI